MTTDRRLAGAALALTLLVAACGGSSASPSASAAAGAATAVASTPAAATQAAAATTDTSGGQSPEASMPDISLQPGNATGLEAMLPDKVGDVTITKTSFDYSTIPWASLGGASGSGDIQKVLSDNGKTLADVKFAMGVATNAGAATLPTMVYALQVSGLDASKFVAQLDSSYSSGTDMTVGGKSVKGSISAGYGSVTYLHADVVFIAIGSEANLNTLVAALP